MASRSLLSVGFACALACSPADPAETMQTEASAGDSTAGDDWHSSVELDTDQGALYSVWGASVDQLYAVGGQSLPEGASEGTLLRFDGSTWRQVELPPDTPKLHWVYGVDDARFIVGDRGVVLHRRGDDDAEPWTRSDCGTLLPLWGVWGAAPDDVWIVGGDGFHRPPVLCHHDGDSFEPVSLPELSVRSRGFFKVWGTSAQDVWIVGHLGVILHYGGSTWVEQPSGTGAALISLWGTSPEEILAVGGHSDGVLVRYDGSGWRAATVVEGAGLNGVWMDPEGEAVVVGAHGVTSRVAPGTLDPILDDSGTRLLLHAVFSVEARTFAVGGNIDQAPPWVGVVLER